MFSHINDLGLVHEMVIGCRGTLIADANGPDLIDTPIENLFGSAELETRRSTYVKLEDIPSDTPDDDLGENLGSYDSILDHTVQLDQLRVKPVRPDEFVTVEFVGGTAVVRLASLEDNPSNKSEVEEPEGSPELHDPYTDEDYVEFAERPDRAKSDTPKEWRKTKRVRRRPYDRYGRWMVAATRDLHDTPRR